MTCAPASQCTNVERTDASRVVDPLHGPPMCVKAAWVSRIYQTMKVVLATERSI